jgi:ATP-dependent Clp protease adapter protein ClpS
MTALPVLERLSQDRPDATDGTSRGTGWKTILFNCDCHSFQEVALQLMKAIGCSYSRGLGLANVVHHTGSAIVYGGARERCEAVAGVLEGIGLRVEVEK